MYEAVSVRPAGRSTVSRMALTAADLGYDGIVVRNPGDRRPEYDREAVAETYDVAVVDGVEITADDPSRASGFLGNHRPKRTIVAVRGGSPEMNRFAVEHPAVDVLAGPLGLSPRGSGRDTGTATDAGDSTDGDVGTAGSDAGDHDSSRNAAREGTIDGGASDGPVDVDHVLAKTAAENGVRIEFDFDPLLREDGGSRVRAIQALSKLRRLVEHYDAPYVVTAGARSHLDLRGPRDLTALGEVVGFDAASVEAGLEEWATLAERNRRRQSDAFVEPGVWRRERE